MQTRRHLIAAFAACVMFWFAFYQAAPVITPVHAEEDQAPATDSQTVAADGEQAPQTAAELDLDAAIKAITPTRIGVQYVDEDPEDLAAIERHRALLKKKVTLGPDDKTLSKAFDAIAEQTGLYIAVSWESLRLSSIGPDSTHHLEPGTLTAKQWLSLILTEVSADAFDDDQAGYTLRSHGLHVSTLRQINAHTVTRLYDVRELIRYHFMPMGMMLDDFRTADVQAFEQFLNGSRGIPLSDNRIIERQKEKIKELERLLKLRAKDLSEELDMDRDRLVEAMERAIKKAGRIKGGGGLFFGNENDDAGDEWTLLECIEELQSLIESTVGDSDEWIDEESIISINAPGQFIISTTPDNHQQIERLLNRLLSDYTQRQVAVLTDMRIMRLLHEAYEASLDGKLDHAMRLVKQARAIDPNDSVAFAMQVIVQDMARKAINPNELARRRLLRRFTASLGQPSIQQALDTLSEKTNAPLEVRWEALSTIGITPELRVEFVHLNRPGNEALRDLLKQVSGDLDGRDKLDYAIRGGKIIIDTRSNLSR